MSKQNAYIWTNPTQYETHKVLALPDQNIEEIAVGERHIVLRTQSRIIGYGDNSKGQLGLEDIDQENRGFVTIWSKFITHKIAKVSCGWNHTLVLDEYGEVFSSGEGKHGALGHGRGLDSHTFKPVPGLKNIKSISAGRDHSLALSPIKVFGWGNSMDGQLGIPKQKICYEPQELYVYPSSLCFAGPKYSIFVTQKGIYATGQNDVGQLGLGNKSKVKMVKKINGIEEQVVWIGGSSSYSFLQTNQNQFYISGTGSLGQYLYPTKIKQFRNCKQLLLGEDFGIMKNENSIYYSWNSKEDVAPSTNEYLSSLPIENMTGGPRLLICHTTQKAKKELCSRTYSIRPEKLNACQKNEVMARSSIEYCFNTQLDPNSHEYEKSVIQKRNRKKSEGIKNSNFLSDDWQLHKNRLHTQEHDRNEENWHQQDNSFEPNVTKKKITEEVSSPYFKKEFAQSRSIHSPRQDQIVTNRTQSINQQNYGFSQHPIIAPQSLMSRQNSKTILTVSEDTDPFCQTSMRRKQPRLNMDLINKESQDLDTRNKLRILQAQNRKKDEEIRKLKRQMLQLIEIVESDMCLKKLAEQNSANRLATKKKQLKQYLQQPPDAFTTNAEQLRGLLGRAIDSLTYSS